MTFSVSIPPVATRGFMAPGVKDRIRRPRCRKICKTRQESVRLPYTIFTVSSGVSFDWEFTRSWQGPENICQVLTGTKVKFETKFAGSPKYGIAVLHSNFIFSNWWIIVYN